MTFNVIIPNTQTKQDGNWQATYIPALNSEWISGLLDKDLANLKKTDHEVIKLEDSGLILRLKSDIGDVVAKHYRKRTPKRIIRNTIQHTRAYRCWTYSHYLLQQGLNTPGPLAYIEEKSFGLRLRAWYISRFDESATCDHYFLHQESISPAMINSISSIIDMFVRLRECQLSHGDFKANNILMTEDGPSLIDLDSMNYHASEKSAERFWQRDIKRFMDNWRERYDIYNQFEQAFSKRGINI